MAPEFLENKNVHFTEKTEVFSFGVLLWEIFSDPKLAREGPYPNLQPVQILFQVLNNGLRPKIVRSSANSLGALASGVDLAAKITGSDELLQSLPFQQNQQTQQIQLH